MQRHKDKILFGLLISALLLTGCITEFYALLPENDTKVLFVDGSIIENTEVTFHITQSFSIDVNVPPKESFINDAILTIIGSNGYKSSPAINQGEGTYRIATGTLEAGVEYGIQIDFESETYQSELSKPLYTPEIDTVYWVQSEPLGPVSFYLSTHDDTNRAKFYLWDYVEDWEIKSIHATTIFFNPERNELYTDFYSTPYLYCWKKQANYELYSTEFLYENKVIDKLLYELNPIESNLDRFSELYCATVTQKAISRGAFEYYQTRKKLNEEMGGLFTPQPAEADGNIRCVTNPSKKAMGYVETFKNISQKRIFIRPATWPNPLIWPVWPRAQDIDDCELSKYIGVFTGSSYRGIYNLGYRPIGIDMEALPRLVPSLWVPVKCTDCTANGGTKDKPDFWPNDHR